MVSVIWEFVTSGIVLTVKVRRILGEYVACFFDDFLLLMLDNVYQCFSAYASSIARGYFRYIFCKDAEDPRSNPRGIHE